MSYLLVGFWYDRPSANAAAIKAFLVNRVGDFGFSLGIFAIFVIFGSLDFGRSSARAKRVGTTMEFLGWQVDTLTLACILLFVGAMGKSAQIPPHLAARRDGRPDPGFGLDPRGDNGHRRRLHGGSPVADVRIRPDGAGGSRHYRRDDRDVRREHRMVQPDIKKVVAYSTCSQLGYMFAAAGVSAYGARSFTSSPTPSSRGCCSCAAGGNPRDGRRAGHAPDGRPLPKCG